MIYEITSESIIQVDNIINEYKERGNELIDKLFNKTTAQLIEVTAEYVLLYTQKRELAILSKVTLLAVLSPVWYLNESYLPDITIEELTSQLDKMESIKDDITLPDSWRLVMSEAFRQCEDNMSRNIAILAVYDALLLLYATYQTKETLQNETVGSLLNETG